MKNTVAVFTIAVLLVSFSACSTKQEGGSSTRKKYVPNASSENAPPEGTGVNRADEMLAKGAGQQLDLYAKMQPGNVGSFHDFVTVKKAAKNATPAAQPVKDGKCDFQGMEIPCEDVPPSASDLETSVSLEELGIEKCQITDAEIICDDAFATIKVTYRLEDGKVSTNILHKFR